MSPLSLPKPSRPPSLFLVAILTVLAAACGGGTGNTNTADDTTAHKAKDSDADSKAAAPPAPGLRRPPTPNERFTLEKLFHEAERVRQLSFLRPVPVEIHDRKAIETYVAQQVKHEELAKQQLMYVALGLLEPTTDIQGLLVRVMGEQIVGYYDVEKHLFIVRDDIMAALPKADASVTEARMIIVHEMVHALQDQHLKLGERTDKDEPTDRSNAYHALVEGDATLAMIGYVVAQMGADLDVLTSNPEMLNNVLEQTTSMSSSPELEQAPAILRVTLIAAYFEGLRLCAFAHGHGGWASVNALHETLPASTEQVMHTDKYAAHEAPVVIALPQFPGLDAAGYTQVIDDTLGELEMGVYFGQKADDVDKAAAAGWGGDSLRVYRKPDGTGAVVWWTAWDSEREAKEAEGAAKRVAGKDDAVLRRGRTLLITRGVTAELSAEVSTAFAQWADAKR